MVQSFRRGVRAMSITTSSKLPGVSVFRAASEVPALVVMDWISGPTLKEALFAKQLNSVFERLDIVTQLTSIIRDAHALPARVLHRDIRPNNVMLRDFWETGKIDVVVLDFDLSWHKDATELSIIHGASTSGYISPEQLDVNTKFSTRSALVDSFGLGMTIFFIFSGRDPVPGESDQREWQEVLKRLAKEWSMADWRSFGSRLARLIGVTTHHDQSRRWDADQIVRELKRLGRALKGEIVGLGADVLSEELFARSFGDQYEAVDGGQSFSRNSIAGTLVNVVPTRDGQDVDLRVSWTDSGQHDYKRVRKWITPALDSACQILSSTGWSINNRRSDPQELEISARISVEDLTAKLDALSKGLQKVADEVAFS
jgi:serine/threonine protein kinase